MHERLAVYLVSSSDILLAALAKLRKGTIC